MRKLKICNLYCCLGGNRKHWPEDVQVTAVEIDPEIGAIYQEYFPQDTVIIGDAHEYLLNHYKEFDFIWSSPPCQTHSDIRRMGVSIGQNEPVFPDMKLWQEIVFLKYHCKNTKFVVENVKPYYQPFYPPTAELDRHYFWSNFSINPYEFQKDNCIKNVSSSTVHYGYDLSNRKIKHRKDQLLRNLVNPDLGLYILEQAMGIMRQEKTNQIKMF